MRSINQIFLTALALCASVLAVGSALVGLNGGVSTLPGLNLQTLSLPTFSNISMTALVGGGIAAGQLLGFSLLGWLIVRFDRAAREARAKPSPQDAANLRLQHDLVLMADSAQRFLVWLRLHGLAGEIAWPRLRTLYEEFCQMTGEVPEDNAVLAKRLVQCGCAKPPLRWMTDKNGKRTGRKQFYIIPDRHEADLCTPDRRADSVSVTKGPEPTDTARPARKKRPAVVQDQFEKIAA